MTVWSWASIDLPRQVGATWRALRERAAAAWMSWRCTAEVRADAYELLAGFTHDGLPSFEALQALDRYYARAGHPMHPVTREWLARMRGARGLAMPLGRAAQGLVPAIESVALASGEDAGDIAAGLRRAASIARAQQRLGAALKEHLAYPLFLLALLGALLVGLGTHVVPVLEEIAPAGIWPPSAQAMAALGRATPWLLPALGLLACALAVAYGWSRDRWTGRWRDRADRWLFPYTLHRRLSAALLLSSLASLLAIGVPFATALQGLSEAGGPWQRWQLQRIAQRLRRGEGEGEALAGPLLDPELRWQVALYGRMTRFAQALENFAERSMAYTLARVSAAFAVIRTLLLLTVAAAIFWVYSAFVALTLLARSGV
jgi:type II secretory pathway component PulF